MIFFWKSVHAQTGNQSYITNPDPQEIVDPNNSANQLNITNPDVQNTGISDDITNKNTSNEDLTDNNTSNSSNTTTSDCCG